MVFINSQGENRRQIMVELSKKCPAGEKAITRVQASQKYSV